MNDRFPHDPEAARAMLAEAGYPDGFPVTFDCPNDRYVNDEAICLAVVPMLKRIGYRCEAQRADQVAALPEDRSQGAVEHELLHARLDSGQLRCPTTRSSSS